MKRDLSTAVKGGMTNKATSLGRAFESAADGPAAQLAELRALALHENTDPEDTAGHKNEEAGRYTDENDPQCRLPNRNAGWNGLP